MQKPIEPEFVESTAGQVAAELARRGVAPEKRVTVTIEPDEPDDWLTKTRRFARAKVSIIKDERKAVQPQIG